MSIGIGIYGTNGHQIFPPYPGNLGRLVAMAEVSGALPPTFKEQGTVSRYNTLEELLDDPRVELVSLCSPRRREQAAQAILALRKGKHVYSEKPCAMDETELDEILRVSKETGRMFHEMAGTAFGQPYFAMRQVVQEGRIGEVVQVICEKSYPYHESRPQDEDVDGGLIEQNAIHGLRLVEHAAAKRIQALEAMETSFGNPVFGGGLNMAACLMLRLENGGLASVSANYLNPRGTGVWGDESLRILGTKGMVESTQGGANTRLVIENTNHGSLDVAAPGIDFLEAYFCSISGEGDMPLTLEEELSPTRWAIRAKRNAKRRSASDVVASH